MLRLKLVAAFAAALGSGCDDQRQPLTLGIKQTKGLRLITGSEISTLIPNSSFLYFDVTGRVDNEYEVFRADGSYSRFLENMERRGLFKISGDSYCTTIASTTSCFRLYRGNRGQIYVSALAQPTVARLIQLTNGRSERLPVRTY
jgi:hypothetical protein